MDGRQDGEKLITSFRATRMQNSKGGTMPKNFDEYADDDDIPVRPIATAQIRWAISALIGLSFVNQMPV
jgi:hypothetical protein